MYLAFLISDVSVSASGLLEELKQERFAGHSVLHMSYEFQLAFDISCACYLVCFIVNK